VREYDY